MNRRPRLKASKVRDRLPKVALRLPLHLSLHLPLRSQQSPGRYGRWQHAFCGRALRACSAGVLSLTMDGLAGQRISAVTRR